MDRSLYFIDFLPLFFLLLFTYFYNEYIDIHIDDDEYIFESQVEPKKELSENEKLNNEFKKIINEYNKTKFDNEKNCFVDEFGNTDFMLAVKANNFKVAKYLFEHNKYDINQKNNNGENALLLCEYGNRGWLDQYHYVKPDMVEFLVDQGIEVNIKDEEGNTPLIKACYGNNSLIVKKLLEAGAEVNGKNNKGETPISIIAREFGLSYVLYFLIKAGADINERNQYGENIITVALHSERHYWAVYTDTRTYGHDNFFTRFYYRVEELLLGGTCCPYHLYPIRFPFNSFN